MYGHRTISRFSGQLYCHSCQKDIFPPALELFQIVERGKKLTGRFPSNGKVMQHCLMYALIAVTNTVITIFLGSQLVATNFWVQSL